MGAKESAPCAWGRKAWGGGVALRRGTKGRVVVSLSFSFSFSFVWLVPLLMPLLLCIVVLTIPSNVGRCRIVVWKLIVVGCRALVAWKAVCVCFF